MHVVILLFRTTTVSERSSLSFFCTGRLWCELGKIVHVYIHVLHVL